MELSKRLQTIASFVTDGYRLADIGTDHGYIPIYLTKKGRCPRAFAMDLNPQPLKRAKQHILEEHAQEQVQCILSDGLNQLPKGEVDSIVIAGMGGDLMMRILENGWDKLFDVKELILSPQSHWEKVRHFLHDRNFRILREAFLEEDGKYYVVLRAVFGTETYEKECFYRFGAELLWNKDPVLLEFLNREYEKYSRIQKELEDNAKDHIRKRRFQVEEILGDIREALGYYEM